jgi:hypothetical protein
MACCADLMHLSLLSVIAATVIIAAACIIVTLTFAKNFCPILGAAASAGSVHSVSSVLSSAFAESAPQRTSGTGSAGQQLLIHPLSEPTDELACFEEEDASLNAVGRSSGAADGSMNAHQLGLSSPGSSSGQQQGAMGSGVDNAWGLDQQQWQQQQQVQGSSAAALSPGAGAHGSLERKGSLKGALRSVVAWGSGLGQRLQRGASAQEKQAGQKQQQQSVGRLGAGSSSSNGLAVMGPGAGQQRAAGAAGSGQELASL